MLFGQFDIAIICQGGITMNKMKSIAAILIAELLVTGTVGAETLSLSGTVEAGVTIPVYAPIGGTVADVSIEAGMHVTKGATLYSYQTEKTYAAEDGTVTGVFAQAGDDAETVTEKYGTDLYIEGSIVYTISASTSKAYSSVETTIVHAGETVYILCRTETARKGIGMITTVDGSNYTVLVTEGEFIAGDSVNIYRDNAYTDTQRIGRGTVARVSPTAVTATGAVVSMAVSDGQSVKRGDLLMETLSGTFEAYEMSGTEVVAEEDGVVTSVTAETGNTVSKGDVVAQIAPISGMRVEASLPSDERESLKAGDKVTIELEADATRSYEGTVRYITEMPEEDNEEVTYKAVIDFSPDENIFFGMTVVVTSDAKTASAGTSE